MLPDDETTFSPTALSGWVREDALEGVQLEGVITELGAAGVARWMVFTREVGEATSLPSIGRLIAQRALEVTQARSARVFVASGKELETVAVANAQGVSSLMGSGLAFETVALDGPAREAIERRALRVDGERAFVPLWARDRGVGVVELLGCAETAARKFSIYASPAALALEGARLNAERGRREREARALAELSKRIGGTLDLTRILEQTLEFVVKSVGLERGMLALYDDVRESTAVARQTFTWNFPKMVFDALEPGEVEDGVDRNRADQEHRGPSLTLRPESFERLVKRNQPIVLNDVQHSQRAQAESPREMGAEAFLMVPLSARGRPLGMLYADTTRAGLEIRERQVSLAQAMAELSSLAIESARLYGDEQRKRASAEALREVVLALSSSLNLAVILERILEHARNLVGASACAIFERDESGELFVRADLGLSLEVSRELRFSGGLGSISKAVDEARPVLVEDLLADETPRPTRVQELISDQQFPFRAMIALPLEARGQSFGGLALYFNETRSFAQDDVQLLELFAAHAAVALENARVFEEEVRREREAEVLLRVARFTGETLDLDEVLTRVASEVARALDLERCFLGFVERVAQPQDLQGGRAELGKLYAYGFETDLEEFRPFVIAEDAYLRLFEDQRPMFFNDVRGDETLSDQGSALLEAQACVIAPLVSQGHVLGILYADTAREGMYLGEREASLAAAIADQAALAIQNARLFRRLETQEAHYRLLAEAANDVIITTDLEGCITYANPAVREVLGFEPSELTDLSYTEILDEDTAREAERAWREMLHGQSGSSSYAGRARRKDGSLAYFEVNLNALTTPDRSENPQRPRVVGSLAIARDLSGQRALAEEIAQRGREQARTLELRSFLSLFTQAQEEERRRIARELHDDTAQTLVAIVRRLDRLGTMLGSASPDETKARVSDIRSDLDTAIDSVRRFSRNLRPSVLDDLGLVPALEWLCAQARTPTRLELVGPDRRLSTELELTLFRVVQEALTNVDKHAQATTAAVRLTFDPDGTIIASRAGEAAVIVTITDDGRGFEPFVLEPDQKDTAPDFGTLAASGHLGLAGMRERVALSGGEMRLETAPSRGSRLTYWFPM
jgi:two-component system, NarL family, sensor histidine kinase UhpB